MDLRMALLIEPIYSHLGKPMKFENLPDDCKKLVTDEYKILRGI